jgi:hypothetical protein
MKYKNISGLVQHLLGHGIVEPEEIIEAKELNNKNFEVVSEPKIAPAIKEVIPVVAPTQLVEKEDTK